MARQTRSKVPSSAARPASSARPPALSTVNPAGLSACLTADELAALLDAPVRTLMGTLDRLAEQDEGEALPALSRWLGIDHAGGDEGVDDELIEAKRAIEGIFATTSFESALFVPLPPLSATTPNQLAPLQQANLARLVLALAELFPAVRSANVDGALSRFDVDLLWQIREGAWREAFSLVGAEAIAVDEVTGEDTLRVGRIIASGRKEKEQRETLLRRRANVLVELCALTNMAILLNGESQTPERLADVFLPTFMGSADQVALPGRERGAVFRSTREKEGVLAYFAEQVEEKLHEISHANLDDLLRKYIDSAVLERMLSYAVRDIWLPFSAQQSSPAGRYNFLDSHVSGERMHDSLDEDLPPSHQPVGETFAASQQSIEDALNDAQVEADLPAGSAGSATATKRVKGKGRKAAARRQASEAGEDIAIPEMGAGADASPANEAENTIDPSLEAEGSGSQSLEYAADDEAVAAAAGATVQASYVDSQESLISSLGAENLWNDFRLQGLPVNEFVQNLAHAQDNQAHYSEDGHMQHPELGGQSVEPSQDDTDTGMREGTGNELAASHDLDGSLPASVLDEPEPHVAAAPAQLSARARGKKRAREPSTSLMLEAQGELGVEADELASQFEGHKGGDDSASLGLDGSGEVDQSLGQPHLETPVKVRKENTGRGNSGKSAKGYLYYQGRNETGRKSWRPEEDTCLLQAMEKFDGAKMMWSKIIGEHGPKGTVDTILADRTSVSCKDRARNLKTIMMRQNTEAPSTFNNITLPKRQRVDYLDGRQASASPSQQQEPSESMSNSVAPAPELEEAALSLQSLTSQHHLQHSHQLVAGPSSDAHWDEQLARDVDQNVDPRLSHDGAA